MGEVQSKAKEISTYLVPAVMALVGVVVGTLLNYQLGLNAQLKLTSKQKRQQSYIELMGRKVVIIQLLGSHLEASAFTMYHAIMWHLAKDSTEWSRHSEETKRALNKAESLAAEMAKPFQALFETLGVIRTNFPYSNRLKELIYQLTHFKLPEVSTPEIGLSAEQIIEWREKTIKDGEEIINEYEKRLNDLINYLETELDKESG